MNINNNKIYIAKALSSLLIFCASTTHAQAVPEEDIALTFDAQFVSIATGGQKELSRAPAVATVITAENIAQTGALNLDQVLESVPGLHVTLSSLRLTPVYSIRGIQSDIGPHVLMLMNGVPITQMWQGDRGLLSTLPVADIARIEIIRGPGSAVYGADAFAGVINVITKSAAEMDGTSISATAGSFGTVQTAILHGKTYDDLDIAFSMQYSGTDGDNDRIINADAQTFWDNDPGIGTNVSQAPGPLDTRAKRLDTRLEFRWDDWQLRAWNWRQKDLGVGPGLAQALDPKGYAETDNWLIDASYKNDNIAPDFDLESKISFMDIKNVTRQTLFPRGAVLPVGADGNLNSQTPAGTITFTDGMIGNPEIYEQHYRADTAVFWTGLENHRWRFAAGAFYSELQGKETKNYGPGIINGTEGTVDGRLTDVSGTEYVYAPNQNRTVYYLSAQDEWYLAADWDLTAGIRYDRYSDFGDTFNPRAALIWHPSYSLSTKLLYGQAFRAPSFQELYAQNNPVKQGNEDLKPENIKTLELALDYQHTFEQRYAASIFAYEIDDQIVYIDSGGSVPQAQNVGRQGGSGFELEMQWSVTYTLDVLANYAYQKPRDKTNNSNAPDSPQQQAYIKANWRFLPGWNLNAQATRVMQRARAYNDNRTGVDDYTIANLAIRKTDIADHWDITVRVSNVFDKNIYEPSPSEVRFFVPGDYPLAGRSWYATAKYRF